MLWTVSFKNLNYLSEVWYLQISTCNILTAEGIKILYLNI
jgi:hypothetical protein